MMSALLPISAVELNVNAEYGYSTREFSKVPNVYVSDDYKSSLFLVYKQNNPIGHRIQDYRNHFTLFSNDKSLIIVRTETSLIHTDNDATLEYETITPNDGQCYRSDYKNWNISFDKITYSGAKPTSFAGYTLIASGEWWFFDNGIILDGLTGYVHNQKCQSILIYYELHVDHKITLPSEQSVMSMPPIIEVTLKLGNKPPVTTPQAAPNFNILSGAPSDVTASEPPLTPVNNSLPPMPTFNLSSVPGSLLPSINAASRPVIRQNDTRVKYTNDIVNKSVMPSLYWFNARSAELCCGSIEYFIPKDFVCNQKNNLPLNMPCGN
ncbi:GrBNV gp23-like protein [Tomelloso virus]|uniref:GrBNV gp23-like protein n=1 Tax=Tomelloso virus TaxID=2053981 RepID=A0A2H4T2R8_9VIRU|nr:GrBNV gp23-like protein [Tomelloso virus]ATY70217.1 GrBNV gp23-like protein [Tomelloso virus]